MPVESAGRRCGVCLVVLDGWGLAEPGPGNAVSLARTPVFDELWAELPHTTLTAWGRAVGLPDGQMGNSEVGHLNLGAGAVVRQDLVRIDDAMADGSLARERGSEGGVEGAERVHLLGLVSDGGVHSSLEHLRALIALGRAHAVEDLVVHAFTDGRDTLPHAGVGYLAELDGIAGVRVGSVVGRYWAMDRDRRWERTQRAYDMLVHAARAPHRRATMRRGGGETGVRARARPTSSSSRRWSAGRRGSAPGDSVIAFNFRPDRMRELTRALAEPGFGEALRSYRGGRGGAPPWRATRRSPSTRRAGPTRSCSRPSARRPRCRWCSQSAGATQLHVAETEKYPHVTYFFNGGEEAPLRGRAARAGALAEGRADI